MAKPDAIAREVMEYLLARLRDGKPGEVNAAPAELHIANGALFAFQRVGLLTEEDARAWQASIHDEGRRLMAVVEDEFQHPAPVGPVAPPPVDRATVEDVLEGQLFAIDLRRQAEASGGRTLHPSDNPAREAAHTLLRALADLRLVSELDERRWTQRFERAADPHAEPLRVYTTNA
jgi:hypothetical protein